MRELAERYKASIIDGIPETNLVAYYPALHGLGGKLLDRSVYANHGTISGATWVRLPSGIYVLSFNGTSDYVDLGNPAGLALSEFTISLWVKINSATPIGQTFTARWSSSANLYNWLFRITTLNKIEAWLSSSTVRWAWQVITAANAFTAGVWVKVTLVVKLNTPLVLCINGASNVAATATPTGIYTGTTNVKVLLGARATTAEWLGGSIALPRFLSRALSVAEDTKHYNRERHLLGV